MFFKKGIVLELQKECLDSHTSIADILRKAKVIAVKLDLKELVDWIDRELNGYFDVNLMDLPEYRKSRGSPKFFNPYRGYCPIIVGEGKYGEIISTVFLAQGVSALEDLAKDKDSDTLIYQYPAALQSSLQEQMEMAMECSLHFSRNQVRATLDYVRNRVLDWTLELEKRGVIGEDLSFDASDKKEAQAVTNHIYGSNIGVLGSVGRDADVSRLTIDGAQPDFDAALRLASQIRETLPALPPQIADTVKAQAHEMELAANEKSGSKLRAAIGALIPVLQGAGGNLASAGILAALGVGG